MIVELIVLTAIGLAIYFGIKSGREERKPLSERLFTDEEIANAPYMTEDLEGKEMQVWGSGFRWKPESKKGYKSPSYYRKVRGEGKVGKGYYKSSRYYQKTKGEDTETW